MRFKVCMTAIPILIGRIMVVAEACSCMWGGPFRKMAAGSDLVIHGRVTEYGERLSHGENLYESMEVQVVKVVKGKFNGKKITILGDRGADCRPYISPTAFGLEKEYLFALRESGKATQPMSVCGEYWIAVKDGTANGVDLSEAGERQTYSVPLDELIKQISEDTADAQSPKEHQ